MRENLSSGFPNNKGADHPVHLRSLISAFVICSLESTCIINTSFYLVSVVVQLGLSLTLSETQKTGFLALGPK